MSILETFPIGTRVRLSEKVKRFVNGRFHERLGRVVGHKSPERDLLLIQWDGNAQWTTRWHWTHLEVASGEDSNHGVA